MKTPTPTPLLPFQIRGSISILNTFFASLLLSTVLGCGGLRRMNDSDCPPSYNEKIEEKMNKIDDMDSARFGAMQNFVQLRIETVTHTPEYGNYVQAKNTFDTYEQNMSNEEREIRYDNVEYNSNLIAMHKAWNTLVLTYGPLPYGQYFSPDRFTLPTEARLPCDIQALENVASQMNGLSLATEVAGEIQKIQEGNRLEGLLCRIQSGKTDGIFQEYEDAGYDKSNLAPRLLPQHFEGCSFSTVFCAYEIYTKLASISNKSPEEQHLYDRLITDLYTFLLTFTGDPYTSLNNGETIQKLNGIREEYGLGSLDDKSILFYNKTVNLIDPYLGKENLFDVFPALMNLLGTENLLFGGDVVVYKIGESTFDIEKGFLEEYHIPSKITKLYDNAIEASKPNIKRGNARNNNFVEKIETPGCPLLFSASILGAGGQALQNAPVNKDLGSFSTGGEAGINNAISFLMQSFEQQNPSVKDYNLVFTASINGGSGAVVSSYQYQINR